MPQPTAARMRCPCLRHATLACALACALAASVAASAQPLPLDDLRVLVESGRAGEAYVKFCATTDIVTRPEGFDLWCGVAAVDLGRPGEGVLALERYVLRFPDDARARLELARAYFYAGDDARARQEFEAVAKDNPPPEVQAGIDRYLAALQTRRGRYETRSSAYVELGAGYDSNANAGVAQADIGLPVLGAVTVADVGVQKASPFGWLAGGGRINHPFAPGWSVNGAVDANGTFYSDASEFNLASGIVSVGGSYQSNGNLYGLSYTHSEILLAGSRYRWTDGVGLDWLKQISDRSSISLTPQYAQLDYSGDNAARNSDLAGLTATYRQVWLVRWQPVLNASLFYGDEHNREGNDYLGRHVYGGAIDITATPSSSWAINVNVAYAESDYQGPIPLLDVTRRDGNFTGGLSAVYFIDKHWSVRAEYQYAHNASNLMLYEYGRHVGALKLRYDFQGL